MFKLNHNHRLGKFVAVSASALMLLSVGSGLGAVHSNVHASSLRGLYSLYQKLDQSSQNELMDAYGDGQLNMQELHQGANEYEANPGVFNELAQDFHYHISPDQLEYYLSNPVAAQQLVNKAENGQSVKDAAQSKQAITKNVKKQAKKGHKRVNKKLIKNLKKHLRKNNRKARKNKQVTKRAKVTKASLAKQMNGLKRQLRSLKAQMKKLSTRKFRTRRGKRYAKRQLAKLNRQYKADSLKLNGLNKQYKAMKATPRKQNVKRHARKTSKKNRRRAKHSNKKQARNGKESNQNSVCK